MILCFTFKTCRNISASCLSEHDRINNGKLQPYQQNTNVSFMTCKAGTRHALPYQVEQEKLSRKNKLC